MKPKLAALMLMVTSIHLQLSTLHAQSYSLDWDSVAGGGGSSIGGVYFVSDTIGQWAAGAPMTGNGYLLIDGFWSLIEAAQAVGPTITSASPLPGGRVGMAYGFTLTATGGTTPYTWSVMSGALPAGLNLSAGGVIGGTPTIATTKSFTVRVKDHNGRFATNLFSLAITAPDAIKPVVSITRPVSGQRWSNAVVTVTGKASDNAGISNVWCVLNRADWYAAASANRWTNWSAAGLVLTPGTNLVQAWATDTAGNCSRTSSVSFVYVVSDRLTLMTAGNGRVSPNYSNAVLELGRRYTLTATPGTGCVLSNWVGTVLGDVVVRSNSPQLSITMRSNLVVLANFVPNPFIRVTGNYNGLFAEANRAQESSGSFTLALTTSGSYNGSLKRGANRYAFSGQFDVAGRTRRTISRPGANTWGLEMALDFAEQQLTGVVSNGVTGGWMAELLADRAVFDARTNPATQYVGKYTLIIPGTEGDPSLPQGHGYGAMTVDASGRATLSGSLADNTSFSQSVPVSKDGALPVYASLYGGQGSCWGWQLFYQPADGLEGGLSWIRPPQPASRFYPAGFAQEVLAVGLRYTPPAAGANRVIPMTNGVIVFEGGNLVAPVTNQITLTASNRVINLSSNKLTVNLTSSSGVFWGSVQVPGTNRSNSFKGALLQGEVEGYGYFLGTNQSGSVFLGPQN